MNKKKKDLRINWLCRFSSKPKCSLMTDAFVKDFITFVKNDRDNTKGIISTMLLFHQTFVMSLLEIFVPLVSKTL